MSGHRELKNRNKKTIDIYVLSIGITRPASHLINGYICERVTFNEEGFRLGSDLAEVETAHVSLLLQVVY